MNDAILRTRLIRLASEHPEFRKDLLPLIKGSEPRQASSSTDAKFKSVLQYVKSNPFGNSNGPAPTNMDAVLEYLMWTWANDLTEFHKWVALVEEFSKEVE